VALLMEELILRVEEEARCAAPRTFTASVLGGGGGACGRWRDPGAVPGATPSFDALGGVTGGALTGASGAMESAVLASAPCAISSEELSRRQSLTFEALAAAGGYAVPASLPLAPPSQTVMGAVLGVAAEADHLARTLGPGGVDALLGDGPSSSEDESSAAAPRAHPMQGDVTADMTAGGAAGPGGGGDTASGTVHRGGYGAMKRDGARQGADPSQQRLASWSDSGGLREATFIKKKKSTHSTGDL